MQFELRWLERETGITKQNEHGYYYAETTKTLQYRAKYDRTIYAGLGPHDDYLREMVWSEWKDVPTVVEEFKKT